MDEESVAVFVCEHGAAKSIVAAAHFNRIAREKGNDGAGYRQSRIYPIIGRELRYENRGMGFAAIL